MCALSWVAISGSSGNFFWSSKRRLPRRAMHAMFPSACCCTRWCRRTTGRQRAHRPLRPRDTSPAAQPKAKPQPDPMRPRSRRLGLGPLSGIGGIGHGRRSGTAPRGRNPTHRRPIRHQTGTKPALVRPPPTRQLGPEGCLNFLYAGGEAEGGSGQQSEGKNTQQILLSNLGQHKPLVWPRNLLSVAGSDRCRGRGPRGRGGRGSSRRRAARPRH